MAIILSILLLLGPAAWAQGRKPQKETSESTQTKNDHPVKTAKDGANDALNDLDKGIHQGLGAAKDGANEALGAVDKGVHKVVGSDKK